MDPWIQPTTAPRQPDLADDEDSVVETEPRVERGWMESPEPKTDVWRVARGDTMKIAGFTAAVVLVYLLLSAVLGPILLLTTQ